MFAGEKFSVSSSTSAAGIGNSVVLVCCAADKRLRDTRRPSGPVKDTPNELNKKMSINEYMACRETRPVMPLLSNVTAAVLQSLYRSHLARPQHAAASLQLR